MIIKKKIVLACLAACMAAVAIVLLVGLLRDESSIHTLGNTTTNGQITAYQKNDVTLRKPHDVAPADHLAHINPVLKPSVRSHVGNGADLPPSENPWGLTYKALTSPEKVNSVYAAKRLYEDTYRCLKFHVLPDIIAVETSEHNASSSSSSAETFAYLTRLDQLKQEAEGLKRMCGSTDLARLKQVLPGVLQNAARLGVEDAAACYVSGQLFPWSQSAEGQAFLPEYRSVAWGIVRSALADGDWHMLHLLTNGADTNGIYASSWVTSLHVEDPEVSYGLNKLELYGASGPEADEIQAGLRDIVARRGLSAEVVTSMDGWAANMYSRYFVGKPRGDLSDGVCTVRNIKF